MSRLSQNIYVHEYNLSKLRTWTIFYKYSKAYQKPQQMEKKSIFCSISLGSVTFFTSLLIQHPSAFFVPMLLVSLFVQKFWLEDDATKGQRYFKYNRSNYITFMLPMTNQRPWFRSLYGSISYYKYESLYLYILDV